MTRPCASCGLRSCDGVACYTEDRPTLTLAEFLAKYGEDDLQQRIREELRFTIEQQRKGKAA